MYKLTLMFFCYLIGSLAGCTPAPTASPDAGADASLAPDAAADAGADAMPRTDAMPLPENEGVTTLAGSDESGFRDGVRDQARFDNPVNVLASDTSTYVADFNNHQIRRISPRGVVSTLFVPPEGFYRPFGLSLDKDNRILYIQTDGTSQGVKGGAIWAFDLNSNTLSLLVDNAGRPRGLVYDDGVLYMADYKHHVVRTLDTTTLAYEVLAGKPDTPGYVDGQGSAARFAAPYDVALEQGGLIISDRDNSALRLVHEDGTVTTLAQDLPGPTALTTCNSKVYLSAWHVHKLYRYDPQTLADIRPVAGSDAGYLDHQDLDQAQFFGLEGISCQHGTLLVADGNRGTGKPYHRIRRVDLL